MPQVGLPLGHPIAQRLDQSPALGDQAHGRALAAGNHQAVEAVQLFGLAHFNRLNAQPAKQFDMFGKCALQGQHADGCGLGGCHFSSWLLVYLWGVGQWGSSV